LTASGATDCLQAVAEALCRHVRQEEAAYGGGDRAPDSLWDHLLRTAAIAQRLGRSEGLADDTCRLAGLFHDAGKLHQGRLHDDDQPEEVHSVALLHEMAASHGLPEAQVAEVAEAILQLYRDDPQPDPLARVLFDADNLDKLGPLGVANFFIKRGLRGRGISTRVLHRFTVELTYARHAPACMQTRAGRAWARQYAPQTTALLRSLLAQLRDYGAAEYTIEEIEHEGLVLEVVSPLGCDCGGRLQRTIWQEAGLKCTEIHLAHTCSACGDRHQLRFCRPRLMESPLQD
jgi:5'-deoxynucleotidase YfbR-like HD superfamily hydrolase